MPMSLDKNRAIYPGSFDPLTKGHVDIIERASRCFDQLIVGIGINPAKPSMFTADERLDMVKSSVAHLSNVKVEAFEGLTVDFAKKYRAKILIRGVRSESDFAFEFPMAMMNRSLEPELEVFFISTSEKFSYISSTLVKDVARWGGDLGQFVPTNVLAALQKKLTPRTPRTP
jgi:pantetheine-phosphate adenylyltransferase